MYHSSEAHILPLAYDCLYAVWDMDETLTSTHAPYIHNYYLIPYCRRPDRHQQQSTYAIGPLPVDITEEYKINNVSLLYNCTLPCTGVCYGFIESCNNESWPSCLDWREICDEKVDCLDGEELEWNECNENEYRCHNGQCIPMEFAWESLSSVDCLDGSDEHDDVQREFNLNPVSYNPNCVNLSIFRCEERTPRYPRQFVCGGGGGEYNDMQYT
ncbi:unnamed protein product [Adineta ricciae]|uniref:Uncharacterized protein n=1 Tax=Adineta ricciae TaxID=249248 RepID=A0A814S1L6_ADIRI|nr:unnamed protein product [Adineta ricciae]CAF1187010.1 unnamed protein product [Adineta ricciae]